jgi:arrestin-related trafficking adapter 9
MVTATLTRPTTISPVTTCEHKVRVIEQIDVGLLRAPRPRTITLEPISKKPKRRRPTLTGRNSIASSEVLDAASDHDSMRVLEDSGEYAASPVPGTGDTEQDEAGTPHQSAPQSPVQSQSEIRSISGDSAISSISANTGRSRNGDVQVGWSPAPSQSDSSRKADRDGRTITAVIQQQKGGCLPGDHVAVLVSVQHIKRIKHSMHGVIVTLYRQSKIDVAPPLSVYGDKAGMSAKDLKRLERDEYYPKSRTGLGGLSLSSAGSYNVFRKDLSQSFSPLILDPATLSASVKTWVRVPEDAFPTIKGIPGDIISFKYHIEVLVDLGGRLAGQLQVNSSAQSRQNVMYMGAASTGPSPFEAASGQVTITGPGILSTERLKRERGVISVIHEVVVGTMDSSRVERAALPPAPSISTQSHADETQDDVEGEGQLPWSGRPEYDDGGTVTQDLGPDHELARPPQTPQYPLWRHSQSYTSPAPAPIYVPPPQMPDESGLSEKERIRRAEQQLLPSKPPGTTSRTISFADDAEDIYDAEPGPSRLPNGSSRTVTEDASAPNHAATAPTLEDIESRAVDVTPGPAPTDDKLERERNRLLQEASAPPEFPADYDDAHAGSSSGAASAPHTEASAPTMVHGEDNAPSAPHTEASAPTMVHGEDNAPSAPTMDDEDGGYGPAYAHSVLAGPSGGTPSGPAEQLPRYER